MLPIIYHIIYTNFIHTFRQPLGLLLSSPALLRAFAVASQKLLHPYDVTHFCLCLKAVEKTDSCLPLIFVLK